MIISTPQEMFQLWEELAKNHKILLLKWDLWAGKTLLTKWFAHWLWIDENIVQSPTYAYMNSYNNKLLHIDMYRIWDENDIWEKWINDQISKHEFIAIERPNFIDMLDISNYTIIQITKDWDSRIVEIIDN